MKRLRHIPKLLGAYRQARRLRFTDRAALERRQHALLDGFLRHVAAHSPYYAPYAGQPLAAWPRMDKARMLADFDRINTAGLRLADVMDEALAAEHSRDFAPLLRGYTVGLSSGTSGRRGVFVVSDAERAAWAGTLLAKALPGGLFGQVHRVALLLRANSNLYETVRLPWLKFQFFDLFAPFGDVVAGLAAYRPTVVVAPAQVLRELALQRDRLGGLPPFQAISAAEVLDGRDRALIECAFGRVHELYQATEGFLAATCSHHRLHLNEEYLHVEPEWLPDAGDGRRRFVPVITDFSRLTQPVVRYRLDDILVAASAPCPCGSATLAIDAVEGRCDDALVLPSARAGDVTVFADLVNRALARTLPPTADYRLVQNEASALRLHTEVDAATAAQTLRALREVLARQGVNVDALRVEHAPLDADFAPTAKRRRIVRACQP